MSPETVMRLECPHCLYNLFEPVRLDKPKAGATCPACGQHFALDPEIRAMGKLLASAHAARKERQRRVAELHALRQQKPMLPGDVLRQLAEGNVYDDIAKNLHLSTSTERTHLQNIYGKLGVKDRAQAVLNAAENGWL